MSTPTLTTFVSGSTTVASDVVGNDEELTRVLGDLDITDNDSYKRHVYTITRSAQSISVAVIWFVAWTGLGGDEEISQITFIATGVDTSNYWVASLYVDAADWSASGTLVGTYAIKVVDDPVYGYPQQAITSGKCHRIDISPVGSPSGELHVEIMIMGEHVAP